MYFSLLRQWQHISHRTAAVFTTTTTRRGRCYHSLYCSKFKNGVYTFPISKNDIDSCRSTWLGYGMFSHFHTKMWNFPHPHPHLLSGPPLSFSLIPCCSYSRLVQNTVKRKHKTQLRMKTLQLIDEQGNNLGVMDTTTAIQLANAKGLEVIQVQKELPGTHAVCKLVSKKQMWENEKRERERSKKDPRSITKEITVSTTISDHDLAVKVNHMRGFLEKTHNVKVCIETKSRRGVDFSDMRNQQVVMLEKIVKGLEDVGGKVGKEVFHRRRLVCAFKSIV